MQHHQLAVDPTEILYAVRMEDLVPILINRLGEESLIQEKRCLLAISTI